MNNMLNFKKMTAIFTVALLMFNVETALAQDPTGESYTSEEVSFTNPLDGAVLSGTLLIPYSDGYNHLQTALSCILFRLQHHYSKPVRNS